MPVVQQKNRIGLIAGWGRYPLVIAQALQQQGYAVCCVGIRDHADPQLAEICEHYLCAGVGRMGAHVRFFRQLGVQQATMAGKIHKAQVLFQRWGWLHHFPDWVTLCGFMPHFVWGTKDRKDDTLLLSVVDIFAQRGIELAPATNFAPELLVKQGTLTGRLSAAQTKDIAFGWQLAKEMGRLDVGQTVVVKGQAVIAVEAVEGTDACIRRAGELCPQGGFTVVKVAKPQQDMRFDVPTIGVGTLETVAKAGGRVLAVEAHKTILLDESDFVAAAKRLGITVVALVEGQSLENLAAA
jgi:UDP-2,3-diacylglucosamine hydrolase